MSKQSEQSRAERTAALMKQQKRQEQRRQLTIIGIVVAVLAILAAGGAYLATRKGNANSTIAGGAGQYSLVVGPDSAPTKVVVYEDFLCPACGYFESASREKFTQAAAEGKLQIQYRPFDFLSRFGDYSARATNAVAAVLDQTDTETAKKFHDLLFENQPSEEGPFPENSALIDLAVEAGADRASITPAIENMEYQDWVDAATKQALEDDQVNSTPTVFLDGKRVEAANLDDSVQQVLDAIK